MKVSIAFMLVALSYCLSTSTSLPLSEMKAMMGEEDIYFFTCMTDRLVKRHNEATKCEDKQEKEFQMKCIFSDALHIASEMAKMLGRPVEDILCEMGFPDDAIAQMQDIMSGECSVDELSAEECESMLVGLLKTFLDVILDLLATILGIAESVLPPGFLDIAAGPLEIVTGLLSALPLDVVTGLLSALPLDVATGLLSNLPLDVATDVLSNLPLDVATDLLGNLPIDVATDLLGSLPLNAATEILEVPLSIVEDVMEIVPSPNLEDALEMVPVVIEEAAMKNVEDVLEHVVETPVETITDVFGDKPPSGTECDVVEEVSTNLAEVTSLIKGEVVFETAASGHKDALEIGTSLMGSLDVAGENGFETEEFGALASGVVEGNTNALPVENILSKGQVSSVEGNLAGSGFPALNSGGDTFGLPIGAKGLTSGLHQQKSGAPGTLLKNGLLKRARLFK